MNDSGQIPVHGRDGLLGWVSENDLAQASTSAQEVEIPITLEDGRTMLVSTDLLAQGQDGNYYLPMSRNQFAPDPEGRQQRVIPVIVEEAQVNKKRTDTARVLIHKKVREHEQVVDETSFRDRVDVEHVKINRPVDAPPKVRFEGETMIIPVLEEVLVVQKRLVLREEVRVTRRRETTRSPQRINLRAEEVEVERLEPDQS